MLQQFVEVVDSFGPEGYMCEIDKGGGFLIRETGVMATLGGFFLF